MIVWVVNVFIVPKEWPCYQKGGYNASFAELCLMMRAKQLRNVLLNKGDAYIRISYL